MSLVQALMTSPDSAILLKMFVVVISNELPRIVANPPLE